MIEDTLAFLDPEEGEEEGYIDAENVKQAFIQTYTDLGGSGGESVIDEVWISGTAPTNPAIELWYDTSSDTPSGIEDAPVDGQTYARRNADWEPIAPNTPITTTDVWGFLPTTVIQAGSPIPTPIPAYGLVIVQPELVVPEPSGPPTPIGTPAITATTTPGAGLQTVSFTPPGGMQVGEVVVVSVRSQNNRAAGTAHIDGSTAYIYGPENNSSWRANWVFVVPVTSSNVGLSTWPATLWFSSATAQRLLFVAHRFANVDATDPVVATDGGANAETSGSSRSTVAYTGIADSTTLVFGMSEFGAPNDHEPAGPVTGFDLVGQGIAPAGATTSVSRTYSGIWYAESTASEPAHTITWGTPVASWATALTLRPA